MLTILNDPAGITGRHRHPWNYSLTIQANIEQHLDAGGDCEVTFNGLPIDPATDARMDLLPMPADFVTVARRPEGVVEWLYAIYAVMVIAAVALMPKALAGSAVGKDSPNNSLTSQSNVARAYQAIPDVYGLRRVWPDLIQPSTVEYIDHIKYVTEWLCISRGLGTTSAMQYAETPIGDINGASYEIFEPVPVSGYPEFGTTTIADVIETFESAEVNGQELPFTPYPTHVASGSFVAIAAATSFTVTVPDGTYLDDIKDLSPTGLADVSFLSTTSGTFSQVCTVLGFSVVGSDCTFTFSSSAWVVSESEPIVSFNMTRLGNSLAPNGPYTLPIECTRLRWNTVFLRGLKGSVTVHAEWWQIDSGGTEIVGTREAQDDTYSADTFDQRFFTTNATPASGFGRYQMQFKRLSPVGGDGADVAKLEELYSVRHYPSKVLPGATIIRVTTKATTEATGFSDRKYNVRWLRHVRELGTDTLSGSRNFARIMAHIWTIAGNDLAQLDTAALRTINDDLGETSDMLRFDGSLDDADVSLGERMQLVANTARCVVWRDGLQWTVRRDQAQAYPEVQLDYRNLASDGESAISYAAHLPASNDGVEIEYIDEVSQAKKAYIRYDITSGALVMGMSRNPKKIKMPGCSTETQADNRAQLEARQLMYQRESVSDTVLCDGGSLGPGSLVRWIDPNDFAGDDGLQAGEVRSIAGSTITTSEPIDWQGATTGRILFTGQDGRNLGAPVVCTPAVGGAILASVPAGLYVADADRQCGSRYAFAVGITEAELEASGLYTVREVRPSGTGTSFLALGTYDQRSYQGDA